MFLQTELSVVVFLQFLQFLQSPSVPEAAVIQNIASNQHILFKFVLFF